MTNWILIIFIVILFVIILMKNEQIKSLSKKTNYRINIKYDKFESNADEITAVQKQIAEKGFWAEHYEWKLMTTTECKIEPKESNHEKVFLVTVKCEHKIEFEAATIERAIVFKKIYECLQQELYNGLGWSSWKNKNTLS